MVLLELFQDKTLKATQKRKVIIDALVKKELSIEDVKKSCDILKDKELAIILEAIEEITNKGYMEADIKYLLFAQDYILSHHNAIKRESSRIIGNLAVQFPDNLENAINCLIENTRHEGTVVRWGSAYALSRIIVLPQFANTALYETLMSIAEKETESGVKNQYVKALKKAKKQRIVTGS